MHTYTFLLILHVVAAIAFVIAFISAGVALVSFVFALVGAAAAMAVGMFWTLRLSLARPPTLADGDQQTCADSENGAKGVS